MKLYTRTGDDGSTGLFGGGRVQKDAPRVEAYGCVDELNATLGVAAAACGDSAYEAALRSTLAEIQSRMFDLGADLSTPPGSKHEDKIKRMDDGHVAALEALIDETDAGNPDLKTFVLPGGTPLSAQLHYARTVCRRAERAVITLAASEDVGAPVVVVLNRLSDLLFAMARRVNAEAGVADVPWISEA